MLIRTLASFKEESATGFIISAFSSFHSSSSPPSFSPQPPPPPLSECYFSFPSYPPSTITSSCSTSTSTSTLCSSSSSSSSYFGILISDKTMISVSSGKAKSNRSLYIVAGVFEKFTERAIKTVMFSQREAKALEVEMVYTQHLLLGLIAEDRASGGFLGSGITIKMARQAENGKGNGSGLGPEGAEVSATDVPFSLSTKRVFEAAVEYSRTMGYNYIAPKQIAVGLFTVDDGSAGRVLKR
ncbi:unnamed protein product [Coffea canephora]|uniref:Clp R domain-containing protein n=1 Tax=Coffea canephora TaxID=49390 RepID=A0A068V9G4_COFCA|nr:unnamed protein product [Coffea canephora]